MLEDSKIMELFFVRTEQAIMELSAKHGTVCSRIARNILKNDLDAEDCVNNTYVLENNRVGLYNEKVIKAVYQNDGIGDIIKRLSDPLMILRMVGVSFKGLINVSKINGLQAVGKVFLCQKQRNGTVDQQQSHDRVYRLCMLGKQPFENRTKS